MKIYHFNLLFLALINGLLPANGARLKCPSVDIANGSMKIRSKGRIIVYKCYRGYYLLGEPYAACIKGKWDSNPPICLRPGCPPVKNLTNGAIHESWRSSLVRFSCDAGYKLVGVSYIYCNGRRWSTTQPYCKAVDIKCDFENKTTCNWEIDDHDDEDFNWRLQQHEPPSRVLKTGPLHDHTLSPNSSGQYLVLETSDYTPSSRPARIHSPTFPQPSDNSSCFIFWYHMYGNTIGTLNVFLNNVLAFQRRGNHGDRWIKGIVSLHENVSTSELQLIIEGSYGGGYTGDIGLDDFSIGNKTDCIASNVTSCSGRCYEDHEDTSFCLCNPECLTDSSCCSDFLDICSLESTTPFFEASTGEDSTQVYSDTPGTTVTEYDTNSPESPTSELVSDETLEHQYVTDSATLSSQEDFSTLSKSFSTRFFQTTKSPNITSKSVTTIKYFTPIVGRVHSSTVSSTFFSEEPKYSTSDVSNFPTLAAKYTNINEQTKYVQSVNGHSTTDLLSTLFNSYSKKDSKTTETNKETDVTYVSSSEDRTFPHRNEHTSAQSTFAYYSHSVTGPYNQTTAMTNKHISQSINNNSHEIPVKYVHFTTLLNKFTTPYIPSKIFTNTVSPTTTLTAVKHTFYNKTNHPLYVAKHSLHNKTDTTTVSTTELTFTKNSTIRYMGLNSSFTTFGSTRFFQTTKSPKITSKSVTTIKYFTPTVVHSSTVSSTLKNKLQHRSSETSFKTFRSTSPTFKTHTYFFRNVSTMLPQSNNFTRPTSKLNITSIKIDKNKLNGSHTHLQTTSQLPPITAKHLVTSIETNTAQIKHNTVSPKKWKSIYKPKDKFMFSAVQRDKSNGNKTFIIVSVCAVLIIIVVALVVIFFIKRRSFRFVNEMEEADTDILYHSSQEMLDLHVARPLQ